MFSERELLRFNNSRICDRDNAELIGICRGAMADGVIVEEEVTFIINWLKQRPHVIEQWPGRDLYAYFSQAVKYGLDSDNEKMILEVISKFTGMGLREDDANISTALPLDDPMPKIVFPDNGFCFTGQFENNTRKECEKIVEHQGGYCRKDPSSNTKYLIIGNKNTSSWMQSTFGRKIQKAMELKNKGHNIAIISEEHWGNFV